MSKLLNFELRKLFRLKAFYICTAVSLLMGIFTFHTFSKGGADYSGLLCLVKAVETSSLTLLMGIWIAIFVCEDYSGGTMRNIVTRGYSRTSVYFAKLIALLAGVLITLVLCWVVCAITGTILFDGSDGAFSMSFLNSLAAQLAAVLAYACLCNTIASALQKTGVSVAVCAVMPIAVILLCSILQTAIYAKNGNPNDVFLQEYWLDDIISALSYTEPKQETLSLAFKTSGVYIAASVVLGWFAIFKREY